VVISDLEELNLMIKREADQILHENGLMGVLHRFGKPFVSGSYFLNLMTWRDLDIYLSSDVMNEESFFELGKNISLCIRPSKMNYRNEYIGRTEHLPRGFYWGCYTNITASAWKVDIWAIPSDEFAQKHKEIQELKSKVNPEQRIAILSLKKSFYNHPLYRKQFFSVDIYKAVLEDKISSEDSFITWLLVNKGITI